MQMSIHYYVLSLSEKKSRLYEGFRDKLIDIQNTNFPFKSSINNKNPVKPASKDAQLREFIRKTDQHFDHYYEQDPLRLVVVGKMKNLAIFESFKTRQNILIGTVEGDYTQTSPHDLGKIVWSLVKEAIAGSNKNAMLDLTAAASEKKIISGIEAVGQSVETEPGSTLYVEEDYHLKGSIHEIGHSLVFSTRVNLLQVIDDVVDLIIEKVLKMGGNVVFLNSGSLTKLKRIALVLRT